MSFKVPSDPNRVFEVLNGVQVLLIFFFIIFLMSYLIAAANRDELTFYTWAKSVPLKYQVAISLLVAHIGYGAIRLAAWLWRFNGAGEFTMFETHLLTGGILLSTVGVLCMIRVFTKPFYGNWPWLLAAVSSILYLALAVFAY